MNRPSKHLDPLSLRILLPSLSLVTRPTLSVFEPKSCHYEYKLTSQLVATSCNRPTLFLLWWSHFVSHLRALTNPRCGSPRYEETRGTHLCLLLEALGGPSNWPVLSNLAIRYVPQTWSEAALLSLRPLSIICLLLPSIQTPLYGSLTFNGIA